MSETYNGWTNYHTWNVALWISSDETLYKAAYDYSSKWSAYDEEGMYDTFISKFMPRGYGDLTGDGVSWTDPTLNYDELDNFLKEMVDHA